MMVLYQVHGELPGVPNDLFADAIADIGLLEQHIAAIFFVGQDTANGCDGPVRSSRRVGDAVFLQALLDHPKTGSGEISVIDIPHYLGLIRNDFGVAVLTFFIGV
jgi:hypothetical protein